MFVFVFVITAGVAAVVADLPSPLSPGDLAAVLRRRNPEVRARQAMAHAAAARPRLVAQLDDPMVSLEWWQQPIDFATVPLMLTLRQPLPWPGKLRARHEVAVREAATARDEVGEAERRLLGDAKRALYDVMLAESTLTINERQHTLLEAMVQAAEARYRVGKAPQVAMLKTEEELLTVENDRLDLQRDRDAARTRLNALLDREPDAPLPPLAVAELPPLPNEDELVTRAEAHRPEVLLARDALAEARARVNAARRENAPELAVWAGYMLNIHGVDTFTTGVSTTLPIFSSRRKSAAVEAAEAEVQAKQAALDAAIRRTRAEVRAALLEIDAARRHEKLHAQKLIPLSELSLQSAQTAYQNDRADFLAVLDAARMLRDHHLAHARYLVEAHKRFADLEQAVGMEVGP
jgi:outer membrane protein TolC